MMNKITRNDFTQEIAATIRGAIDLKDLIITRENDRLEDVIRRGYPYVLAHEKVAGCVDRLVEYEEDSLPVLSESGGIVGVLTAQDLVELVTYYGLALVFLIDVFCI